MLTAGSFCVGKVAAAFPTLVNQEPLEHANVTPTLACADVEPYPQVGLLLELSNL
jgi:hypothetical protein